MGRKSLEISALDSALSAEFAKERIKRGWSESELGRRAGIAQSIVHRIITGEYAIKISQASALAEAFGLSLKTFIARAEDSLAQAPQVLEESLEVLEESLEVPELVPQVPELVPAPPLPDAFINQLQQDLAAGKYDLAAKHHEIDPLDSRGEESQTPPEEYHDATNT